MPRVGGWYLVLLRVVSDGLQVTHQELECLVVMTWQVPDLRRGTGSPLRSPPPPFPPRPAPQGGLQGCAPQPLPHLPTSFRSVLILSLASSIRLASMKSLYLSERRTQGGSEPRGEERAPPGPGTPGSTRQRCWGGGWGCCFHPTGMWGEDKDTSWPRGLREEGVCRAPRLGWALARSVTGSGDLSPTQGRVTGSGAAGQPSISH